ncbi:hypothetical protein H8S75_32200 [Hungatella sp. L12]|uniref:Zinc ribbon domain-containing protein n=1 Tax=Hungatella hominis TaxID=2763050 RepID=A0ABR7HHD4_9FIRM|nr:hypothetical protein [Hungatella hominis]MBC5712562.1 hypothetical protein [Hungatella hominis]
MVKVVVPELVGYFVQGTEIPEPEYNCTCGMGVAEEYKCCPYCGAELAWKRVAEPSKKLGVGGKKCIEKKVGWKGIT